MISHRLVLLLLVPLSACALWTDFKRPETPLPEDWKTEQAQQAPVWPDSDWWKQFKSPILTQQIDQALKANFDLAAAVARVRQADAQVRISGAPLLPSVGATADASRNRAPSSRTAKSPVSNAYSAGLNASYEIDFWGKNWAAAEASRELAKASRYDQETVKLTVTASVATTWFDILATQERLSIAHENLDNAQQVLDSFRKRFRAGTTTALDVAQQESVVEGQRATIPPLELRLQQDLDAQAILLGTLPENMNAPQEKLADMAAPDMVAGLPSELLERRPDVQTAEAQLASAHANIINARAAFFPSISLTAQGGYQSAALANLFRPDSMLWSVGGSLAQPIFEGGLLEGQLELQKARYDELLQNYRKAVISAFGDTEDALAAVQKNSEEETAQAASVETARKAYDLSRRQLEGGIINIETLLGTQRTLFAAQDAYAQARLAHLQAIVGLYKVLGGGWSSAPASNVTHD